MKTWDEINTKQKIERWENVLRVLRALTPHERKAHWDMSQFSMQTSCGTIACAAGHCAFDPWFRRRGFAISLRRIDEEISTNGRWIGSVVKEFFGEHGANTIFFNGDRRPVGEVIKEVLTHIRELHGE